MVPIKPHSSLFAAIYIVLTSVSLMRQLATEGWRTALARLRKGARIAMYPGMCLRVAKVFISPATRPVVQAEPQVMFKYLSNYVALGLSRHERASILIDNYAFLEERAGRHFFRTIIDDRLELWRQGVSEGLYRIYLAFPRVTDEGDLTLILEADSVDICTLSFSIGPGCIAGLACRVLYIACVQGKGRALPLIREATKNCCDVAPAAILLAAAEGIATALGLDMVGIGASNQISKDLRSAEEMFKAYDEFWLAAGGVKLPRNMYYLSVPLLSKPIKAIKRNHRSRTVRKREYKKLVKEEVCRAFRNLALNGNAQAHDRCVS